MENQEQKSNIDQPVVSGSLLKFPNGLTIEGNKNIDVKFIDGEVNIKSDKGINLTMDYKKWIEFQK